MYLHNFYFVKNKIIEKNANLMYYKIICDNRPGSHLSSTSFFHCDNKEIVMISLKCLWYAKLYKSIL